MSTLFTWYNHGWQKWSLPDGALLDSGTPSGYISIVNSGLVAKSNFLYFCSGSGTAWRMYSVDTVTNIATKSSPLSGVITCPAASQNYVYGQSGGNPGYIYCWARSNLASLGQKVDLSGYIGTVHRYGGAAVGIWQSSEHLYFSVKENLQGSFRNHVLVFSIGSGGSLTFETESVGTIGLGAEPYDIDISQSGIVFVTGDAEAATVDLYSSLLTRVKALQAEGLFGMVVDDDYLFMTHTGGPPWTINYRDLETLTLYGDVPNVAVYKDVHSTYYCFAIDHGSEESLFTLPRALSAYQEPFDIRERVFVSGASGKVELHTLKRIDAENWEDTITPIADGASDCPAAVLHPDGIARLFYSTPSGAWEIEYSDDSWATHSHLDHPGPDNTPWSGYGWAGPKIPSAIITPFMACAKIGDYDPSVNPKMGGDIYLALWSQIAGFVTGIPNGLAYGNTSQTEFTNQWVHWQTSFPVSEIKMQDIPLIPTQSLSITRQPSGEIRVFYFTGSAGAWILRSYRLEGWLYPIIGGGWGVIQGPIDGDGSNNDGTNIPDYDNVIYSNGTHKCPAVVYDPIAGKFYMVTWCEDGYPYLRILRLVQITNDEDIWEVTVPVSLYDRIQYGQGPYETIPEQKVALYIDNQGALRCFWWDEGLRHATIITDVAIPPNFELL